MTRPGSTYRRHGVWVAALALLVVALILAACAGTGNRPTGAGAATPEIASSPAAPATRGLAQQPPPDWDGQRVRADALPPEAVETLAHIADGGPFPYDQDGSTFQNREGILPARRLGFYREYTVEMPGSPDRGARRLVVGDDAAAYYTEDHYASFRFVEP